MVELIEDRGRSAWKGDHLQSGDLGRWRARVAAGEIKRGSVLVVENLDRLSRQNSRIARRWIEDLTDAGISVAVCTPDLFLDAAAMNGDNIGAIVIHLLESTRANKESTRRSEFRPTVIAKQRAKAREGKAFTKRLPAYLEIRGDKVHAIPQRAALIVMIYELAETMGYDAIARKLNAKIPPWNGKRWNIGYIKDLLWSPIVEGEYRPITGDDRKPTGEVISGYFPRIVPAVSVERARAAIMSRNHTGGANRAEAQNLFAGVVECAECGGKMTRTMNRTRGVTYAYFICRAARAGACRNVTQYRYDLFEKSALNEVLHLALDSSHFVKTDEVAPLAALAAASRKVVEHCEGDVDGAVRSLKLSPTSVALHADLAKCEKALAVATAALEAAETDLAVARGQVSPEEHFKRVVEVRHAIHSDDPGTRTQARRSVRSAISSVVSKVVFDRRWRDNLRFDRRVTLIMRGNHIGWLFDGEGNVLERHDYQAYADAPARSRDQVMSYLMRAETNDNIGETQRSFEAISKRYAREKD